MFEGSVWDRPEADEQPETVRAAVYARTSKSNPKFGYSLKEQVRRCLERCEFQQWLSLYVFQDEAKSGKDVDRPQFQILMDYGERRLFDVVVFWKLDRFSRSLLHVVQLERQLREWDIALHSVTEQIDTTTSAGRFNFRNIASAAEFERDMIRDRSRMGLYAMAMDGRWPNKSPPLGYDIEDGRLVVNEPEAQLVKQIFHEYLDRKSMSEVAQQLNERGVQTKRSNEWCARAVGDVLRNVIYTGEYRVAGVSKQISDYRIVSEETFSKASATRNRFKSGDTERTNMSASRKSNHIDHVVGQYELFVEGRGPKIELRNQV